MNSTEFLASINAFYIMAGIVAIGFILLLIAQRLSDRKAGRR